MPSPKFAPPSLLHRILRTAPGRAPAWLCSRNSCDGFDLLVGFEIVILLIPLVASWISGAYWPWIPTLVTFGLFLWFVHVPFADRERKGRARLNRGECIWCGTPNVPTGAECPACLHLLPRIFECDNGGVS